jgi:hypothetical protein
MPELSKEGKAWIKHYKHLLEHGNISQAWSLRSQFYAQQEVPPEEWARVENELARKIQTYNKEHPEKT